MFSQEKNIANINHKFTEIHIQLKIKQTSDIMRPSIIYLAAVNTLTYIYRILKSDKAETEITDQEHLIPWSSMRLNLHFKMSLYKIYHTSAASLQ